MFKSPKMQPFLNFFIFVHACPYLYLLSFLKVFQAVVFIFHTILWPDLAKCSLKLLSNIQPFICYFRYRRSIPLITCTWREEAIQTKIRARKNIPRTKSFLTTFMVVSVPLIPPLRSSFCQKTTYH